MIMTLEKTIERLKYLHKKYEAQVQSLNAQRDAISKRLEDATSRAIQTADAIAALEGRPTLYSDLRQSLAGALAHERGEQTGLHTTEYHVPDPGHVGETAKLVPPPAAPSYPAEPGFKWVKNEDGEWVLIPENTPQGTIAAVAGPAIILPAVGDDFSDSPDEMITGK